MIPLWTSPPSTFPACFCDTESAVAMKAHGSREAAVLIPIRNWPEAPRLILTERRADLQSKHAGEISFRRHQRTRGPRPRRNGLAGIARGDRPSPRPGRSDREPVPPVGTFATSFRIQPIVGLVAEEAKVVANPDEVATILYLRLRRAARLLRDAASQGPRGVPIRTPTFEMDRHLIWGATARILTDFFHRIGAMK